MIIKKQAVRKTGSGSNRSTAWGEYTSSDTDVNQVAR